MEIKKALKYTIIAIFFLAIILLAGSTFLKHHVEPTEVYKLDSENPIENGSFENFNQTAGDCCNGTSGNASIFATKSNDSYEGKYSLNLTSGNHCACIGKQIMNFTNLSMYLLSFYYKGDNSQICNWVGGNNQCIPNKIMNPSKEWNISNSLFIPSNNSISASITLYASSDGTRTVTNLYDDLQVHKLTQINNSGPFFLNQPYVILTNKKNLVEDGEFLSDSSTELGSAYYLITGEPEITIKFPIKEIILIFSMILITALIIWIFKED